MVENLPPTSNSEEVDLILPADYMPAAAVKRGIGTWVKPLTIVAITVILLMAAALWFIFTAKSVYFEFNPQADSISISGGVALPLGTRYLLRPGQYIINASADGYYPFQDGLTVTGGASQKVVYELDKLPGLISILSNPAGAEVVVDGEILGVTPLLMTTLEAGVHSIELVADRYLTKSLELDVTGLNNKQTLSEELVPGWSEATFASQPSGASVWIDGEDTGIDTPATIEIMEGPRQVELRLTGFKDWIASKDYVANEPQTPPLVTLEPADGLLRITSSPAEANVTINNEFRGKTPLSVEIEPGKTLLVSLFKAGYEPVKRSVSVPSGDEQSLAIKFRPVLAEIRISSSPSDAQVYVNGQLKGQSNQVFKLGTQKQRVEIRKEGYVSYVTKVIPRPGIEQEINALLKTEKQARWEAIPRIITTASGQQLRLYRPGKFTMGASRREAGRRSNEALRTVELTRPFYIATTEVTNAEFRKFNSKHSSGNVQGNSLDGDTQPVVKVDWIQAALYCNWLSEQEGLTSAYAVEGESISGFDPATTGYRLPTEAEWAWSARTIESGTLKYPWGKTLPPPAQAGNFADRSAAYIVGRVISEYDDSYSVTSPVGSFGANDKGLYDIGGNVAEWTNDYYATSVSGSRSVEQDPLGPTEAQYRVIRGSSWAHGTITELRLSYRDYGTTGRNDIGFRIAKYLE